MSHHMVSELMIESYILIRNQYISYGRTKGLTIFIKMYAADYGFAKYQHLECFDIIESRGMKPVTYNLCVTSSITGCSFQYNEYISV